MYTPSLSVAQQLLDVDGVDVHLFGGHIDTTWLQTVGTPREQGAQDIIVQTLFLGAFGIDSDLDVVDQSPAMAESSCSTSNGRGALSCWRTPASWGKPAAPRCFP